jgi:nucleoside-triphosphatase THEP1
MARWAVVTYDSAVNRAAEVGDLAERLRARGLSVAGFVQEKRLDAEGHASFELLRLRHPERHAMGTTGGAEKKAQAEGECTFTFSPAAFARARAWLEEDAPAAQVLVLSEVSKHEVSGQGHHDALVWALGLPESKKVVLVARANQLSYLVEKFAPPGQPAAYLELPATPDQKAAFVEALAAVA